MSHHWLPHSSEMMAECDLTFPKMVDYHFPITTNSTKAQAFFDQGMGHSFGFNQQEALSSFTCCALADTTAPMCQWGIAYAHGPFLNKPTCDAEDLSAAFAAAQTAAELAKENDPPLLPTPLEVDLINAAVLRFPSGDVATANQTAGFTAWRDTLADMAGNEGAPYFDDDDVTALYAESLMTLMHTKGEDYYYDQMASTHGAARSDTLLALAALERVMERSKGGAEQSLALHLYVHITEPLTPALGDEGDEWSATRGEEAADRLAALNVTGSGHLEHMPGHLYLRVGRYNDAVLSNALAHTADDLYLSYDHLPYGPGHNTDFLVHAAAMDGQSATALRYSQIMRDIYSSDPSRPDSPGTEEGWNTLLLTFVRFAQWQAIIDDNATVPLADPGTSYSQLVRCYARGLAFAALGRTDEAEAEAEALESLVDVIDGHFASRAAVARLTLLARLADSGSADSITLLQQAASEQDGWGYNEPPLWFPTRQCLGQALLTTGAERAADADAVFRDDLALYPGNGWSLFGLYCAMQLQSPAVYSQDEVDAVAAAANAAWQRADVELNSACRAFDAY